VVPLPIRTFGFEFRVWLLGSDEVTRKNRERCLSPTRRIEPLTGSPLRVTLQSSIGTQVEENLVPRDSRES